MYAQVGPYNNPQETYSFYSLPFCRSGGKEKIHRKWAGIGESLQGHELVDTNLESQFGIDVPEDSDELQVYCTLTLTESDVEKFKYAIDRAYWYELYIDDLPVYSFVGERGDHIFLTDSDSDDEVMNKVIHGVDHHRNGASMDRFGYVDKRGGSSTDPDQQSRQQEQPASYLERPSPEDYFIYNVWDVKVGVDGEDSGHVVRVDLSTNELTRIYPGATIMFKYKMEWEEMYSYDYEHRFDRYLDNSFFEHTIHWFSLLNAFMMVLFLLVIVAFILLRTLRRDISRYGAAAALDVENLEADLVDEFGWKLIHGDVFRPGLHQELQCAIVGTGCQLIGVIVLVVVAALMNDLHEGRGQILGTFIVLYSVCSLVAGYVSGSLYVKRGGKRWIRTLALTSALFPGFIFIISSVVNCIAWMYGTTSAAGPGVILVLLFLWGLVSVPMCILGTVFGRHWTSYGDGANANPCRVKRIPSPIPRLAWYLRPIPLALAAGVLPFGSIFIEMYFVFTSFWNYKVYYVYGFMLIVLLILVVVQACSSVVATYALLNAENYHWQWTSLASGFATGLYLYLYSVYYFVSRTSMTGLFQVLFYFGAQLIFCTGIGLICAATGHLAANRFVRAICRTVKCD